MVNPPRGRLDALKADRRRSSTSPGGGSFKLVARRVRGRRKARWDAWKTRSRRSSSGRQFSLTTANPFGLKPFYALHAWVWKKNPSGWLQPWNPTVSCPS